MTVASDEQPILKVTLDPESAALDLQRNILNTLPALFVLTPPEEADIYVSDPLAEWWDLPRLRSLSPATTVVLPQLAPLGNLRIEELIDTATQLGLGVNVLASRRHDSAFKSSLDQGRGLAAKSARLSIHTSFSVPVGSEGVRKLLSSVLLEQLDALCALRADPELTWARVSGRHYAATGPQGLTLTAAITHANQPATEIELLSTHSRWTARFDESAAAAPTTITVDTASGVTSPSRVWEHGARNAWRALHEQLATGQAKAVSDTAAELSEITKLTDIAQPVLTLLRESDDNMGET